MNPDWVPAISSVNKITNAALNRIPTTVGICYRRNKHSVLRHNGQAGEGDGTAAQRLEQLQAYRQDLIAVCDAICSALQLINFWQDLCVDIPRSR